jgi:hypothetical protein
VVQYGMRRISGAIDEALTLLGGGDRNRAPKGPVSRKARLVFGLLVVAVLAAILFGVFPFSVRY